MGFAFDHQSVFNLRLSSSISKVGKRCCKIASDNDGSVEYEYDYEYEYKF
jgi:hypothetical protein